MFLIALSRTTGEILYRCKTPLSQALDKYHPFSANRQADPTPLASLALLWENMITNLYTTEVRPNLPLPPTEPDNHHIVKFYRYCDGWYRLRFGSEDDVVVLDPPVIVNVIS